MKKLVLMGVVVALGISVAGCTNDVNDKDVIKDPEQGIEEEIKLSDLEEEDAEEKTEVMDLVSGFGEKMKNVSLLAPEDDLKESMNENYSEYVSEELLTQWIENPEEAPGRLVSSPWPESIDIIDVEKVSDGIYKVEGEIIEKTSNEVLEETKPITIEVEKVNDNWMIISWK